MGKTIESGWDQRGLPGAVGSAISMVPAALARPVVLGAKEQSKKIEIFYFLLNC